jgi:hypothetical protein
MWELMKGTGVRKTGVGSYGRSVLRRFVSNLLFRSPVSLDSPQQPLIRGALTCRRRHGQSQGPLTPATLDSIAISLREVVTLVTIFEHAHAQIARLDDAGEGVIADASGSVLIPELYARSGWASLQGVNSIPLLVGEIGLLEAAVVNLESYEGNEVLLVTGYGLLDVFGNRKKNVYPLRYAHGILTFADEAGDTTSGSATPSLT